jgi:hypothetical protein
VYWCEGGTPACLSTYRYYQYTTPRFWYGANVCTATILCPEKCNGMNMDNADIVTPAYRQAGVRICRLAEKAGHTPKLRRRGERF